MLSLLLPRLSARGGGGGAGGDGASMLSPLIFGPSSERTRGGAPQRRPPRPRPRRGGPRRQPYEEEDLEDEVVEDDDPLCNFLSLLCVFRGRGRCACFRVITFLLALTIAVFIGITRNMYCNPEALRDVEPPYFGQLLPGNFSLRERKYFFQFTKLVDVFEEDGTYVGYFYDINLFVIMRFGFSDPSHRIWFEARYASFLSRFKPIVEYNLQRCDAGAEGRDSAYFQVKEDWWNERWFCIIWCNRLFNLSSREADGEVTERLVPPAGFGQPAVARAEFDSTLSPTYRGRINGPLEAAGVGLRHRWWMRLTTFGEDEGSSIATAWQHFNIGTPGQNLDVVSRWQARTYKPGYLPNWVIAYMTVLDDLDEEYDEDGTQDPLDGR